MGHRWHASRGHGGGLAGERVGPDPGLRYIAPTAAAAEDAAAGWLLDLLGLPTGSDVGFTTGATMAGFTGLMAARFQVLADAGWDVNTRGLSGAPAVTTLVGAERHDTIDCALRYLGLGAGPGGGRRPGTDSPRRAGPLCWRRPADRQSCACRLEIFTPARSTRSVKRSRWRMPTAPGCMDGAFGLWAAAAPSLRHHLAGWRRGLVVDRCAQDVERALRQRPDHRGGSSSVAGAWCACRLPTAGRRTWLG